MVEIRKEAKASRCQKGKLSYPVLLDAVLLKRAKEYGGCCTRELTGLFY
jgi:hypothetical protein